MTADHKVLIIDDDKFVQKLLQRSLSKHFDTLSALDGNDGIYAAKEWCPSVILLDVEMPGRNGYEVCDELKHCDATKDIPVVFLSGNSSIRERMLGYEMGAEDYLVKPCDDDELLAKLFRITKLSDAQKDLEDSVKNAQQTAMEAMSTSFELGKAVRFVESTYSTASFDALGDKLMEMVADLGLSAVAGFITRTGWVYFSTGRTLPTPIEIELMQMLHSGERYVDFGCRTVINFPQVTLLVKTMPLDDPGRYGRLKDTFPFVLGATDARLRMLDAELALVRQSAEMTGSVESVRSTLVKVEESYKENLDGVSEIMSDLITNLTIELGSLGLEVDQENFIYDKVDAAAERVSMCKSQNETVQQALNGLVETLVRLAQEQHLIIANTLASRPAEEADVSSNDIELF